MQALVTGGAGFIGSTLVRRLLRDGCKVRILDVKRGNLLNDIPEIDMMVGDIRDADAVNQAAEGCDVIFHQAAIPSVVKSFLNPRATMQVGVDGFLNVLQAAHMHRIRRVVAASSSAIYGDSAESPKVETMLPKPKSPYALSKLASEQLSAILGPHLDVTVVSLRYFNVYGPGQAADSEYAAVIPRFINLCVRGERPTIYGSGLQTRDFIHVDDIVTANLMAATVKIDESQVVNLGSGEATSLIDLLALIGNSLGCAIEPRFDGERPGDIQASVASVEYARSSLGFQASVNLSDGVADLVHLAMTQQVATAYDQPA